MKDIKDYIHLYIGCEIHVTTQLSYFTGKLVGYYHDIWNSASRKMEPTVQILIGGDLGSYHMYKLKDAKLILRRLSSLKKEDIDLGAFIPEFEVLTQKFTGGYCIEIDSVQYDGYCLTIYPDGSMYCICKDNLENYPYKGGELFAQLLRAGFDLFGLIDSNLAIDSSTITENKQ